MTDFGYNTIGVTGTDNPYSGWVWCKATTTPASNGTLTSISAYCQRWNSGDAGTTVAMALYSDVSGQPNTLLAANETGAAVASSIAWVTQSGFSLAITAGTQYWFCIKAADFAGSFLRDIKVTYDNSGGIEAYYRSNAGDANPGAFPATVAAGGGFDGNINERWSIYGTYTPSASSTGPTSRFRRLRRFKWSR